MNSILVIGMNHKTAPVALREYLAFSAAAAEKALDAIALIEGIDEVMILSTCNRVEIYITTQNAKDAFSLVIDYLARSKGVNRDRFDGSLYVFEGQEAVRHIFRVASSLDSMMLGEPQILGQIKEAYRVAATKGRTGVILNRLMHRAFFVAKRIRNETGIADHAVSISYAAIELGRKIFGELKGKSVLLIGAGEMAELAVENLKRHRVKDIFVANRTFASGVALARRFKGKAISFDEIDSALGHVDIVISSTGAPGFIITSGSVRSALRARKHRPIFFIDIAVPRDIDPEVNRMDNAYLYDIDDLKNVIEENIEDRKKEAVKAKRIVDEAVMQFVRWYKSLEVVPTIVAMRKRFEDIVRAEIEKTVAGLPGFDPEYLPAMQKMADSMVKKLLHHPTLLLKSEEGHSNRARLMDVIRRLFNLDVSKEEC